MTKAALLSTCCDPFTTSLCLKFWKERWYSEVDHFYINLNNHCKVPPEVIGEFMQYWANEPKITFIYHSTGKGNGPPQVELLKICETDLILLLEEDFFIFESGVVDGYFKKIESGEADILGSPRYTYGEVADAAKKMYNLDYSGIGDRGFGYWPTGFYCKKSDLLKTDLDFGSKEYKAGAYYKELDHTFTETSYTDTFTWASLQLRYLGLKSIEIPQYHASPFEIEEYEKKELKWAEKPGYIHGGSLSAGWGGYLQNSTPDTNDNSSMQEIETRCAFWQIASETTEGFDSFKKDYQDGIIRLIERANLDNSRIEIKKKIYRDLMKI